MKKNDFVDFVKTSGKNIGEIQNTKLAEYFDMTEGGIRRLRKKENNSKFNCLYLGALCKANNISKEDLINLMENRNNSFNTSSN